MRKLSPEEIKFVEELLGFSAGNGLEKLQMGHIISNMISFHGIKCSASTKTVEIYKTDEANANRSYTILMGLFSFLYEMKEHGYIGIDTIINKDGTTDDAAGEETFWIYNHETYGLECGILCIKTNDCLVDVLKGGAPLERFHSKDMFDAMKDMVYNKVIYPLPALIELKKNDFQSIEDKRHLKNVRLQWVAIGCAIVFPFLNTMYSNCKGTQIHSTELQHIDKKIDNLNRISVAHPDTIKIECISSSIRKQDSTIMPDQIEIKTK